MRRYIFGELDGIHIIDLIQTEALLENARRFAGELASGGGTVLFVGTKKQARGPVQDWAERCKMPYVNQRWLGGLLTNFNTISQRISRLHELTGGRRRATRAAAEQGEDAHAGRAREVEYNLGGVRDMDRLPDAVFVTDLKTRRSRCARRPACGSRSSARRHQLRPDPGRLRDPRQRRRDPLLQPGDRDDRRRDRRGRERLARAGGEAPAGGDGTAKRRRKSVEARGGREGAQGSRGGGGESGGGEKGCGRKTGG